MNPEKAISSVVSGGLALFSIIILVSQWIGFVSLNPLLVWVLSIAIFWILWKKYSWRFPISVPKPLIALAVLFLLMELYPFFLNWGFFPSSADAITTIVTRVLEVNQRIPSSYDPFAPLSLSYQLGFPLLSAAVHSVLFFLRDFQVIFLLAAFFGLAQLVLFFELGKTFFNSEKAGYLAAVLFVSSKLIFQNLYWGEFAWVAATAFLLASVLSVHRREKMHFLFLPAIFAVYPAVALNAIFLFAAYFVWFTEKRNQLLYSIASVLLALPSIAFTYVPLVAKSVSGKTSVFGFSVQRLIQGVVVIPPWVGVAIFLVLFSGFALWYLRKKQFSFPLFPWAAFWVYSAAVFFFFWFTGTILSGRVIELVSIASIFLCCFFWLPFFERNPKKSVRILLVFLLIGLFYFASSNTLQQSRAGSKILPEERIVAQRLYSLDSSLQPTIFLTRNGGKMAELSNKIAFDWNSDQYVSTGEFHLSAKDSALLKERHKIQQKIILEQCLECIDPLDVKYVVVDEKWFQKPLPYPVLFSANGFVLYKKS